MSQTNLDKLELAKLIYFLKDSSKEQWVFSRFYQWLDLITEVHVLDREDIDRILQIAFYAFEREWYEYFLYAIMKIQAHQNFDEKILQDIFDAFVNPNIEEYRENYEWNKKLLEHQIQGLELEDFECLEYYLIPTQKKNQFFFWNKKEERIEWMDLQTQEIREMDRYFSDYLIAESHDIIKAMETASSLPKEKRKYLVFAQGNKLASMLQGEKFSQSSLLERNIRYFFGWERFFLYLKERKKYLPRNICCEKNYYDQIKEGLDQIHQHRIKNKRPEFVKPILAIGIPTWNRGKDAYQNVIHCLESFYDYEIEIVVSDNGSDNHTQEYYQKIAQIQDSRLNYHKEENNVGFGRNVINLFELSKAKYILFTSDTDQIHLPALDQILYELERHPNPLSMMKVCADRYISEISTKVERKGEQAIKMFMLTGNYLPGSIFNREILMKCNWKKYFEEHRENHVVRVYMHMVLELFACMHGDVKSCEILAIKEKVDGTDDAIADIYKFNTKEVLLEDSLQEEPYSERLEKFVVGVGRVRKEKVLYTYSVTGRLNQHKGFFEIFLEMYERHQDTELLKEMYCQLCWKTLFLIRLNMEKSYLTSDLSKTQINEIIEQVRQRCILYLDRLYSLIYQEADDRYHEIVLLIEEKVTEMKGLFLGEEKRIL